jgi:iron-sulfur cluster assembly accessory protein
MALITITQRAGTKIRELLARDGRPQAALRLRVAGGGCSGLRYELAFDDAREDDHELEQHGVAVVVDPKSAQHLGGCTLDYADGLNENGFRIENPNAATTCGCGESFGV